MSNWEHTKRAKEQLMASPVFADIHSAEAFIKENGLFAHAVCHVDPVDNVTTYRIENLPGSIVAEPFDAPKRMTMGEFMKDKVMPTAFNAYDSVESKPDDSDMSPFERMVKQMQDAAAKSIDADFVKTMDAMNSKATISSNLDEKAIKARSDFLIKLSQLSLEDALRINPDTLLKATMEACSVDAIMAETFFNLNRQPTQNAIHRTVDFMLSTTQTADVVSDFDDEPKTTEPRKHRYLQQMDKMLDKLNNLMFVSKARIIMDDFPESISLSVQLLPSINEEDTVEAMEQFESILQSYKPKNLIELEVSITNKVVY